MIRSLLSCALVVSVVALATAQNQNNNPVQDKTQKPSTVKNGHEATITKVDAKNHAVTVKMKDKDGKDVEKTFKLAETVEYLDSTGKAAALDIFKSGDMVLIVEAEGQLKAIHKKKEGATEKK
jgi:Ni/Co efflux regulator RcnB